MTAPIPGDVSFPEKQGCFVRLFHSLERVSHASLTPSDLVSHLPQLWHFPRLPEGGRPCWEGVPSGGAASTRRQDTDIYMKQKLGTISKDCAHLSAHTGLS